VSVLVILEESLKHDRRAGPGVLLAMGPGFCAELVLLQC
jgi:predicted naringenin-chalcone synthase